MSHTLMSLDAEWRRLTRTSRARRAPRQWSIAHPALRGLADLDELLERRRDDQAASAILRALAVLAPADDLAARTLLQALLRVLDRFLGFVVFGDVERGLRRRGAEAPAWTPFDGFGPSRCLPLTY